MKRSPLLFIGIFFIVNMCNYADGSELSTAILSVKSDIEKETIKLNDIREKNANERLPIVKKLNALEKEVVALRDEARFLKALSLQSKTGFIGLKDEVGFLIEEHKFSLALLSEYRRDVGKSMGIAEQQRFETELKSINILLNKESTQNLLLTMKALLGLVQQRNRDNAGGFAFKGKSMDKQGILHNGNFILCGPITYFVSETGNLAGIVDMKLGSNAPAVVAEVEAQSIKHLCEGKQAAVPVDFTLGGAIKIKSVEKSWLEHIRAGGITMIPILGLGFICSIIAMWKMFSLSKLKTDVESYLSEIIHLIHSGKIAEAKARAKSIGQPVGPVLMEGVEHHSASREHIEEIMHEKILFQIPYLETGLHILAVSAAAAPLLGLLGTVTGMIHTFNLVTIFGTGKASLLSGGISEALITTEYGLIIAIPALLIHAYLSRRVKVIIHTLEQTSIAFINGLKIKGNGQYK